VPNSKVSQKTASAVNKQKVRSILIMNKLFLSLCFIVFSSVYGLAQSSDDYNKNEFYVGYSNQQVDNGQRNTYNGFEGAYVRNFSRYVGVKGDFSAAFNKNSVPFQSPPQVFNQETKQSVYNALGGIQIKDNASTKRLQPFAHLLVGAGHYRIRTTCPTCPIPNFKNSDTGFAGAFGGGLDIKLSDKINLRAIQVDYNPMRVNDRTFNNVRFGIGIVFK
jgi:opacity protein-like surface antigen